MAISYVEIIGLLHPTVEVDCIGDPYVYSNIQWRNGDPIPQAVLDAEIVATDVPPPPLAPGFVFMETAAGGGSFVTKTIGLSELDVQVSSSYSATFHNPGVTSNKWLSEGFKEDPSCNSPYIVPWTSRLAGISFSNSKNNVKTEVRIYSMLPESTITQRDMTWTLNAVRSGKKTDLSMEYLAGAKLGIYLSNIGGPKPVDPIVTLFFRTTSNVVADTNIELFDNSLSVV